MEDKENSEPTTVPSPLGSSLPTSRLDTPGGDSAQVPTGAGSEPENSPEGQGGSGNLPPGVRDSNGRFVKGSTGNAGGMPKGPVLARRARSFLMEIDPNDPQGRTRMEITLLGAYKNGLKGNTRCLEMLWERAFGKVADRLIQDSIAGWRISIEDADGESEPVPTQEPGE